VNYGSLGLPQKVSLLTSRCAADGRIIPEGYIEICRILRDVQAEQAVRFDLVMLDISRGAYGWLRTNGVAKPLIINSGYRNLRTSADECGKRNSLHF
jgi:uncharacterized protein YcbK (DUF882 family)